MSTAFMNLSRPQGWHFPAGKLLIEINLKNAFRSAQNLFRTTLGVLEKVFEVQGFDGDQGQCERSSIRFAEHIFPTFLICERINLILS
jgi:hypothetical protein